MGNLKICLFILVCLTVSNAEKNEAKPRHIEEIYFKNSPKVIQVMRKILDFKLHLEDFHPKITRKIVILVTINCILILFLAIIVPFLMNYNVV